LNTTGYGQLTIDSTRRRHDIQIIFNTHISHRFLINQKEIQSLEYPNYIAKTDNSVEACLNNIEKSLIETWKTTSKGHLIINIENPKHKPIITIQSFNNYQYLINIKQLQELYSYNKSKSQKSNSNETQNTFLQFVKKTEEMLLEILGETGHGQIMIEVKKIKFNTIQLQLTGYVSYRFNFREDELTIMITETSYFHELLNPLSEVLTFVHEKIRTIINETGFGTLVIESAKKNQDINIIIKSGIKYRFLLDL
jgi:hypothetical protein